MKSRAPVTDALRVIRSRVGNDRFALEMSAVLLVKGIDDLRYNWDGAGPAGWIDEPDGEIEVYSLSQLFGLHAISEDPRYQVVIVQARGRRWGLMVDDVSRAIHVPSGRLRPLPGPLEHSTEIPFKGVIDFTPEATPEDPTPESDLSLLVNIDVLFPMSTTSNAEIEKALATRRSDSAQVKASRRAEGLAAAAMAKATSNSSYGQAPPPQPSANEMRRRVLTVGVAGSDQSPETYPAVAVSQAQILEIFEPKNVLGVPRGPQALLGLTRWRDQFIPVIDMGTRLGLPACETSGKVRVVVAQGADGEIFAFPVRSGIQSLSFPTSATPCRVPENLESGLIRGAFTLNDRTILVPDLDAISL